MSNSNLCKNIFIYTKYSNGSFVSFSSLKYLDSSNSVRLLKTIVWNRGILAVSTGLVLLDQQSFLSVKNWQEENGMLGADGNCSHCFFLIFSVLQWYYMRTLVCLNWSINTIACPFTIVDFFFLFKVSFIHWYLHLFCNCGFSICCI